MVVGVVDRAAEGEDAPQRLFAGGYRGRLKDAEGSTPDRAAAAAAAIAHKACQAGGASARRERGAIVYCTATTAVPVRKTAERRRESDADKGRAEGGEAGRRSSTRGDAPAIGPQQRILAHAVARSGRRRKGDGDAEQLEGARGLVLVPLVWALVLLVLCRLADIAGGGGSVRRPGGEE